MAVINSTSYRNVGGRNAFLMIIIRRNNSRLLRQLAEAELGTVRYALRTAAPEILSRMRHLWEQEEREVLLYYMSHLLHHGWEDYAEGCW